MLPNPNLKKHKRVDLDPEISPPVNHKKDQHQKLNQVNLVNKLNQNKQKKRKLK